MIVRPFTPDDRPQWAALWQESVDGVMQDGVIDHSYRILVDQSGPVKALLAEDDDGTLVGLLHYVVHPVAGCIAPVCYMQDLFVSPACRRQGVARALLAELKKTAEHAGYDRIYWLLENGNDGAKAFYEGMGVALDFGLYILPVKMRERLNLPETA